MKKLHIFSLFYTGNGNQQDSLMLQVGGTSYAVRSTTANNVTIEGFIFDGKGTATRTAFLAGNIRLDRCLMKNGSAMDLYILTLGCVINNCVFGKFDLRKASTLSNNLINVSIDSFFRTDNETYSVTNCKININGNAATLTGITVSNINPVTFLGCKLNLTSCLVGIYGNVAAVNTTVLFDYCQIIQGAANGSTGIQFIGSYENTIIRNCTIVNNSARATVTLNNLLSIDINNNLISSDYALSVRVYNTAVVATVLSIKNNTIKSNHATGYGMSIGNETTLGVGDNTMSSITIENNKLLGIKYFNPLVVAAPHGIFIGFQAVSTSIKNNYINGHGYGIVIKGSNSNYENCIIQYNIITNNISAGIYCKGAENSKIYGNTFKDNNIEVYCTNNLGSDGSIGQTVKNNIFHNTLGYIYSFDTDSYSGHAIDYNVIYGTDKLAYNGSADIALAAWNTAGYDTHSEIGNPLLVNLIPESNSPAIGAGVALDAAYDDGLDASSNWGTDSQLPVVVTKQQSAAWDIGAYVS